MMYGLKLCSSLAKIPWIGCTGKPSDNSYIKKLNVIANLESPVRDTEGRSPHASNVVVFQRLKEHKALWNNFQAEWIENINAKRFFSVPQFRNCHRRCRSCGSEFKTSLLHRKYGLLLLLRFSADGRGSVG